MLPSLRVKWASWDSIFVLSRKLFWEKLLRTQVASLEKIEIALLSMRYTSQDAESLRLLEALERSNDFSKLDDLLISPGLQDECYDFQYFLVKLVFVTFELKCLARRKDTISNRGQHGWHLPLLSHLDDKQGQCIFVHPSRAPKWRDYYFLVWNCSIQLLE